MEHKIVRKIVVEREGEAWHAYFKGKSRRKRTYGTGRSKAEAVGSLVNFTLGNLILDDPEWLGFEIEEKRN